MVPSPALPCSIPMILRQTVPASLRRSTLMCNVIQHRKIAIPTYTSRKEGDISDAFVQLSGQAFTELPPRFADLKTRLIAGHEDEVHASWNRLLSRLSAEIPIIASLGPAVVPSIDFADLDHPSQHFRDEHRKRGVAVIRNVIPEEEAMQYKEDLKKYLVDNPHTKAFPPSSPQVFELYWSPSQLRARSHPNLLRAQQFLMQFWHSKEPQAEVSSNHPISYADRLRIRQPGDTSFALGPHVDGGSVERWEENGYGRGHVYDKIFQGKFEEYDPFESSCRLLVQNNLYNGAGSCSMFRMYQGWLSMSHTAPGEGTLLVNPLLALATSYMMLRPFFSATIGLDVSGSNASEYLHPSNWKLNRTADAWLQGASMGHGQELTDELHPHLNLPLSMVHVPRVNPGDYVAWHCDTIHGVDTFHCGASESGVMYIPTSPLTEVNAEYLKHQRAAFMSGVPGPDFPGGDGESRHVGRLLAQDMKSFAGLQGLRAFGLEPWDSSEDGLTTGERIVLDKANKSLGFYP